MCIFAPDLTQKSTLTVATNKSIIHFSGRVDSLIGYTVRGRHYFRSRPCNPRNPKTPAQQAHRQQFALVSSFVSTLRRAYLLGYANYRPDRSPRVRITEHIFASVLQPDGTLDLTHLLISQGPLQPLLADTVTRPTPTTLRVTFRHGSGNPDDRLQVLIYNRTLAVSQLLENQASRRGSALTVPIPSEWQSHNLFIYAFYRNPSTFHTSDSILLAQLNTPSGDQLLITLHSFLSHLSHNWPRLRSLSALSPLPPSSSDPPPGLP